MTQNLYYYEDGYIEDSYFVYTADADCATDSSFSCSIDANKLAGGSIIEGSSSWLSNADVSIQGGLVAGGSSTMIVQFNQSCMISHINGADLLAMSSAALSAAVDRIRDNNVQVSGAYTITANAERTRWISGSLDTAVSITMSNLRVRYDQADMSSAFSINVSITRIKSYRSNISSNIFMTPSGRRIRTIQSNILSSTTILSSAINKSSAVVNINSNFNISASIRKASVYWVSSISNFGQLRDSCIDSNGNIISIDSSNKIIKRNVYGIILSQFEFISSSPIYPQGIAIDSGNNIYVSGTIGTALGNDAYVVKIDASNNILWQRQFASASNQNDQFTDIQLDSQDNPYVVGTCVISSVTRPVIYKLNSSTGTITWSRSLTRGYNSSYAKAKVYGGYIYSIGDLFAGSGSAFITKHDSLGTLLWVRGIINASNYSTFDSIDIDSSGNIYTLGSLGTTTNTSELFLIKFDASGNKLWAKSIDFPSSFDYGYDLTINNSEIFISGFISSNNNSVLLKFDANGNCLFQRSFVVATGGTYPVSIKSKAQIVYIDGSFSAQLPTDGSLIGTYGNISYVDSSFTISDSGLNVFNDFSNYTNNTDGAGSSVPTYSTRTPSSLMSFSPIYIVVTGFDAKLESASTVQVTATKNIGPVVSSLSSNSTVVANTSKINPGNCDVVMDGTILIAAGRIRPFIDLEISASTLTASVSVVKSSGSSLNASTSTVVYPTKVFGPITINASSNASLTTTAIKTSGIYIAMTVDGFVLSSIGRIVPDVADLYASTTLSASVFVGKIATIGLSLSSTLDAIVTKQIGTITVSDQVNSSMVVSAVSLPSGSINAQTISSISITANRLRSTAIINNVNTSVLISAHVTRTLASSISCSNTVFSSVTRIKQLSASFVSTGAELVAINKIGNTLIHKQVTATMNANVKVLTANSIYMEARFSGNNVCNITKTFNSQLLTTSSQQTIGESGIIGELYAVVSATIQSIGNIKRQLNSNILSQFTTTINSGVVRDDIILEMTVADMLVTANIIKNANIAISNTTLIIVDLTRVKSASADLRCDGFVMGEGKVINLQASEIYVVPAEFNLWSITPETNYHMVGFETRTYKIKE